MLLLITLAFLTSALIFLYKALLERQNYWKSRGISGPESHLLFSNIFELTQDELPLSYQYREWTKQYGKNYGIIDGFRKVLVSSDVKVLHDVFIAKFENFYGRKLPALHEDPETAANINIFTAQGRRWKRLRAISSPSFSVNSLKKITPTLSDSIHTMLNDIDSKQVQTQQPFNIHTYFQELTLDVISRVALGQKGSKMFCNPLFKFVKDVFEKRVPCVLYESDFRPARDPLILFVGRFFPAQFASPVRILAKQLAKFLPGPVNAIEGQMTQVVEERKQNKTSRKSSEVDFIDLFLNAEADAVDEKENFDMRHHVRVEKKLTEDEIKSNCLLFLLAGYDTTSNALAYASFYIARDEEVRRRMQEEIDEICVEEVITFDHVKQLKYTENVLKEALRLHPLAALVTSRRCMADTVVGDGIKIEKGTYVHADAYSLQTDEAFWGADAKDFHPERFAKYEFVGAKNFSWEAGPPHPAAWIPFGVGPRMCLGIRFALLESKLTLAYLLRKYDIVTCASSERELVCHGAGTIAPDAVTVMVRPRLQ